MENNEPEAQGYDSAEIVEAVAPRDDVIERSAFTDALYQVATSVPADLIAGGIGYGAAKVVDAFKGSDDRPVAGKHEADE